MRFLLCLLLLVGLGRPGFGQGANPASEVSAALPASFPFLLAQLRTLPWRLSFDDSLARHYYVRNRVKAVTLLRLLSYTSTPDTVDHTELDRAGYAVLIANPSFKQTTRLRYNRRHQLISSTSTSALGVVQTIFDPTTKTTTTHVGPTLATLALSQTGRTTQDTRTKARGYEAFLLAVPQAPPPLVTRILLRNTSLGGDTVRLDVLGYHGEEVVRAEAYYTIGRASLPREGGTVVLPTAGRPHRALEGHYIPNQLYTYTTTGWLVRSQTLQPPPLLADKPVTQTSADGSSVTTGSFTDTLTTTYTRNTNGQLLREDFSKPRFLSRGEPANLPAKAYSPRFSTYEYLPNGLRSKSDKQGVRYEYHYTFY